MKWNTRCIVSRGNQPREAVETFRHLRSHEYEITLFSTVADWDSMGHIVAQTRGRAFQTFGRAFDLLLRLQKLGQGLEKFGRAFERLGRVF